MADHTKAGVGELIDGKDMRGAAAEPSWLRQVFARMRALQALGELRA